MSRGIYGQRAGWPAVLCFVLLLLAGSSAAPAAGYGQILDDLAVAGSRRRGRSCQEQQNKAKDGRPSRPLSIDPSAHLLISFPLFPDPVLDEGDRPVLAFLLGEEEALLDGHQGTAGAQVEAVHEAAVLIKDIDEPALRHVNCGGLDPKVSGRGIEVIDVRHVLVFW